MALIVIRRMTHSERCGIIDGRDKLTDKLGETIIMPISPELLEILRCPQCKSELEINADQSRLKCLNPDCSLVYPIRDEIPVMLVEEATVEK